MGIFLHWLHGTLIRWMYRILAPKHPRGWLDFHAVIDDDDPSRLWIHCHGMERWQLPNLEIVDVPDDLRGYAHGILFELSGYTKNIKPVRPDENIGGLFVDERQPVVHEATLRAAPVRDEHAGFLRVVDLGEPVEAGFPYRLFAAHLCALASTSRWPGEMEQLARRATEIYAGEPLVDAPSEVEAGLNPNNYCAWELLGNALCDQERTEEGLACLEECVARWPAAGLDIAKHIREQVVAGHLPPPDADPRSKFWNELDVEAVRAKVVARRAATTSEKTVTTQRPRE